MNSIIITAREGDPVRDKILKWVIKRYQALFPQYELILEIENRKAPLFHKAEALNRAFKRSGGEIILQSDADIFCNHQQIENAIKIAQEKGWALPYRNVFKLNKSISNWIVRQPENYDPSQLNLGLAKPYLPDYSVGKEIESSQLTYRNSPDIKGGITGYLMAIHRDAWCGYDKRFMGWGFEDVAFRVAMETLVGLPGRISGNLYHLWHPLNARLLSRKTRQFNKNKSLYIRYLKAKRDSKEAMIIMLREGQ